MKHECVLRWTCVLLVAACPEAASAQSATYHLHKEASATAGLLRLSAAAPDAVLTPISLDLKKAAANEYLLKAFDTASGVPNAAGIIPAGSMASFTLWMRKTSADGVLYPRAKLRLNSATGPAICTATGTAPLTTTAAAFTLTCSTTTDVAMSSGDRFYLWAGVNLTTSPGNGNFKAELSVEGTLNGSTDSFVSVPLPSPPPAITALSPASGSVGTSVSIAGSNFGAAQGTSRVTFSGAAAAVSAWTPSSITAVVPPGAATGSVVVTVRGLASNGVPFTLLAPTAIAGIVSHGAGGASIAGASVVASLAGTTSGSATTAADGSYTIGGLVAGSYELRVNASGYSGEVRPGVVVLDNATTTTNVALSAPGALSGRVTEADGTTPIVGASVSVLIDTSKLASTNTDAGGFYAIAGLHPGTVTVQASAIGRRSTTRTAVISENTVTDVAFALGLEPVGTIAYAYDALDRLIQVTDGSGDFAIYRYDAVGNILAIDRPVGGVSISGFSPGIGAIGTSVTIYGAGFSTNPTQNVVTVGGAQATVASATQTSIVVSVPNGAATGPVAIATTSGTATSAAPFTVLANGGSPLITSITPTIGVAGTTVTVSGINFDPSVDGSRADLNGRVGTVQTATSSTLTMTVPSGVLGGRIGVTTAFGRAVSPVDFVVPPSPYSPTDVEAVGRFTLGASASIAVGTSGKVAVLLFDGVSGQRVSFSVGNSTFGGSLIIYRPDSLVITSASTATNTFIDALTLPLSGTYTVLVDPTGTSTGNLTLNSYTFSDVMVSADAGAGGVPIGITAPGQNAYLMFNGTAGQMVSATATSSTWTSCQFGGQYSIAILNPDGSLLGNMPNECGSTTTLQRLVLPGSGQYALRLDPLNAIIGSATLQVYVFTDVTAPIAADGVSVAVTVSVPGQLGVLTFHGVAGQIVSTSSYSTTLTNCQFGGQYSFGILKPDGSWLVNYGNDCGTTTYIDRQTLPSTGTYTLRFDPYGAITGTVSVSLFNVVDVSGPIVPNGPAVTINVTTPGQYSLLTFTGTAGQVVTVNGTSSQWNACSWSMYSVYLFAPNGSTLGFADSCWGNTTIQKTLPANGVYTIRVDPAAMVTGSATFWLTGQ